VNARILALPALALVLVGVVLGVQVAYGGGTFSPLEPADPCVERSVTSQSDGIDALTEQLVLIGLDEAACSLGTSREALTLSLARAAEPSEAEVQALQDGLVSAVGRMADAGTLPPASALVDDALDQADLNGLLESLIRALPDPVVDSALHTDDVLVRAIEDLDMRELLSNVDDQQALDEQIEPAVTQAVKDSLLDRLRSLL
jgi:hypothetical protein